MKTVKTKCKWCQKEFEKTKSEYNRSKKLNRPHFCGLACTALYRNKNWSSEDRKRQCYPIKKHSNNARDEYSPFRKFLQKGRASLLIHKCDIDVVYLKELWEKQNGICPYTGIKMILPETTTHNVRSPKKASLDRIDSSKEYVRGNVEFVCCAVNLAKNSFTRDEMKEFFSEIVVEPPGVEPGC